MSSRIATFNLKDFFLPKNDSERAMVEAKVANVAKILRRANADVVALQEVGEEEHLTRLVSKELGDLGYGVPVMGTADRRGIRCAILSRLPVLWSQVHTQKTLSFPRFVEGDPDPFPGRIPLRRGIVHVRVDAPGLGEIDVLTAHFKSNLGVPLRTAEGEEIVDPSARGRGEAAMRSLVQRAAEALFVRGLVDDILKTSPDHHVCVLGDLNDRAESLPVRLVKGMGELASGMLKSCADLLPEERRYSCFHANEPSMIDHILVSERLYRHAKSYAILNEDLRYHGPHVEPTPLTEDSDHALCVVELA
ncbi:MAG: endonuclease/exonuclease/phosphatase family protein [Deltaproteobacteria bacterium]|nr:endonuclease/exonuclease/phosphatase family protein [Deltaproteobacteria bacterium]